MRVTVEGVLVVHERGHPCVLMLQIAETFFKLPGDVLRQGEDEIEGLKLRLSHKLSAATKDIYTSAKEWKIGQLLATWWRPNFETFVYPYLPPHITNPKEIKRMYLVHLPSKSMLHFFFLKLYKELSYV